MASQRNTTLDVLSAVGACFIVAVVAALIPQLRTIVLRASTAGIDIVPTHLLTATSVQYALYAVLVVQRYDGLFVANVIGTVIAAVAQGVHAVYAPSPRARATILLTAAAIVAAVVTVFAVAFSIAPHAPASLAVGSMCVTVYILSFISPLRSVYEAVRTLDAARVPVLLTLIMPCSGIIWGTYGALLPDPFILWSNVAGTLLMLAQVAALVYVRCRLRGQPTTTATVDADSRVDDAVNDAAKGTVNVEAAAVQVTEQPEEPRAISTPLPPEDEQTRSAVEP